MHKYRIVQVKPVGLDGAFSIDEYVTTPASEVINPKYRSNLGYWQNTFALNAGAKPADWFIVVPEKQEWKQLSYSYSYNTLQQARESIHKLCLKRKLADQAKAFKRIVIEEYD